MYIFLKDKYGYVILRINEKSRKKGRRMYNVSIAENVSVVLKGGVMKLKYPV
jgi:hypothetical protein